MEKVVQISVRIPESLKRKFEVELSKDARGLSQSQIIRYWIDRYVSTGSEQGMNENEELAEKLEMLEHSLLVEQRLNAQLIDLLKVSWQGARLEDPK